MEDMKVNLFDMYDGSVIVWSGPCRDLIADNDGDEEVIEACTALYEDPTCEEFALGMMFLLRRAN